MVEPARRMEKGSAASP